jgi:hypothetical protein
LKDQTIFNNISSKYRQKSETIQHKAVARRALTEGGYTNFHNQAASSFHQELTNKRGTSKGKNTILKL